MGCSIDFSNIVIEPTVLEKEVRTDVSSSTSVTLNNTLGIAGGQIVRFTGFNVDNSAANLVEQVSTPDANGSGGNGVFVVDNAQTLTAGTVLTFLGCFAVINFSGSIIINSFPDAKHENVAHIDRFLSVGTQSG